MQKAESQVERKLAAIMIADVVGSTAATALDEEGAVARIRDAIDAVAATAARHGGRVFSTAGDATLLEFPSAVNALRAAMEARGIVAPLAPMRFGLHLADVIVVGDDLRGDGVNLAARVQAAAAPGEIEVTSAIRDHVRAASPCVFEPLGERSFKGQPEPVAIWRVVRATGIHRFANAAMRTEPPALEPRPNSICVARFRTASSADDDQSYLAEALSDDLTVELSRIRRLFVSSPSAAAKIDAEDPVTAGQRLGVRWMLSGWCWQTNSNQSQLGQ